MVQHHRAPEPDKVPQGARLLQPAGRVSEEKSEKLAGAQASWRSAPAGAGRPHGDARSRGSEEAMAMGSEFSAFAGGRNCWRNSWTLKSCEAGFLAALPLPQPGALRLRASVSRSVSDHLQPPPPPAHSQETLSPNETNSAGRGALRPGDTGVRAQQHLPTGPARPSGGHSRVGMVTEPRSPPRRASAGPRRARRPHHDGPAARAAEARTSEAGRGSRCGPPRPRRPSG